LCETDENLYKPIFDLKNGMRDYLQKSMFWFQMTFFRQYKRLVTTYFIC
jgi:hypothetical protein